MGQIQVEETGDSSTVGLTSVDNLRDKISSFNIQSGQVPVRVKGYSNATELQ